jgi:hypothetical protein
MQILGGQDFSWKSQSNPYKLKELNFNPTKKLDYKPKNIDLPARPSAA